MDERGIFPVTVPLTAAGAVTTPMTATCRLCGWSLKASDVASLTAAADVVAPGAGATIVQLAAVPAGEYTCKWSASLTGAAAAADQDNMAVFVGGTLAEVGQIPPAAGNFPQADVVIVVPAGGATVAVKTNGAGTAAVTYGAALTLTGNDAVEAQILDGGQVVANINLPPGGSETKTTSSEGIYLGTNLTVSCLVGSVSGAVYVRRHQK